MAIETIGVIGAGVMGAGIAQVAAACGYKVILTDVEQKYVEQGIKGIQKNLERLEAKGKLNEPASATMARITPAVGNNDLASVDLVFEAIIENMEIKKQLYSQLDQICKPEAIFCSNTSGLSITEIAAATRRPSQVIGTHFFNPVPAMKLVELIKGYETSEATYTTAKEVCEKMGKKTITVNEAPLFAVNRVLIPMMAEAMFAVEEGVASAEDIDTGMKLGANHPMGPLALADLIGLDVVLMAMDNAFNEMHDPKFRAPGILRKLVRAGHYGRKTGRGFYDYQ